MARLSTVDADRLLNTLRMLGPANPFIKYNRHTLRVSCACPNGRTKGGYYSKDEVVAELALRGLPPDHPWDELLVDLGGRYSVVLCDDRHAQHGGDFRTLSGALAAPALKTMWSAFGLVYDRDAGSVAHASEPLLVSMCDRW